MAEKSELDLERFSPEKQLLIFSKTRLGYYIVLVIALHFIVTLATSMSYIRGWMDPEWKAQREEAYRKMMAEKTKSTDEMKEGQKIQDERKTSQKAKAAAARGTNQVAGAGATTGQVASAEATLDAKIVEAFRKYNINTNNPVIMERLEEIPKERWLSKEILESFATAKTNELPKGPDKGLDLKIEDTR